MISAYTIGVNLLLETNTGAELTRLGEAFKALDKILIATRGSANELGQALRYVAKAEPGIRTLAMSMERLAGATWRAAENATRLNEAMRPAGTEAERHAAAWERAAAAMSAMRRDSAAASGGGGRGGGGRGGGLVPVAPGDAPFFDEPPPIPIDPRAREQRAERPDFASAAVGFGALAYGGAEVLKHAWEAGAERDHILTQLQQLGFSPNDTQTALATATAQQQQIPGLSIPMALDVMKDMAVIMKDPAGNPEVDRIMNAAPGMMRLGTVLAGVGKGNELDELFKALQSAELRGQLSEEQLPKFLANVEATTLATGGRVGPAEILQTLKSAGIGGAVMSDEALFQHMIAPVLSLGAAGAGTGEQGFYQQFGAGRMSEGVEALLESMGFIKDPSKMRKSGMGQFQLLPGALDPADEALIGKDPAEFLFKRLMPKIHDFDMLLYGKDDMETEQKTIASITSRIPGGRFLGDMLRLSALLEKESAGQGQAARRDAFGIAVANDPKLQQQAVGAALDGFFQALANPDVMKTTVGVLKDLTGALNTLANLAKDHPEGAKNLIETVAVLTVVSTALTALSTALALLKPMLGVLAWMFGEGVGGGAMARVAGSFALFGPGSAAVAGAAAIVTMLQALYGIAKMGSDSFTPENRQALDQLNRARRGLDGGPNGPTHDGFDSMGRPIPQPQGFHMPGAAGQRPIVQSIIYLDGRVVARAVSEHQAREASRPDIGPTRFDPSVTQPWPHHDWSA